VRDAVGQNQAQGAAGERRPSGRGISKQFGGTGALDSVTLTSNAGETLAQLGENRAAKSTLIKLLANIHTLGSGRIVYRDGEVSGSAPRRRADPSIENRLAAANANARSSLSSGATHANHQV